MNFFAPLKKILTLLYSNVTHDYKDPVFDEVYEM